MKRLQTRRLGGVSAVLVLAGAVALAGAPGAWAADDYLQFSPDGKSYGRTISGPVFSDPITFIPGAGQPATIWVRNNSKDPAWLSSAAVMVRSDPELNGYLGLTAAEGSGPAVRVGLGSSGTCRNMPKSWDLNSGQEIELTFVVDMSLDAPNGTQNGDAEFDLLFYLESREAGLEPRDACSVLDGGTDQGENSGPGTGTGGGIPPTGRPKVLSMSQRGSAPAVGSLAALPGNGTSSGGLQAMTAGAVAGRSAARVPAGTDSLGQQAEPQVLDAMVQSTVEPVIRSLSGTLLIAMSVAFTAAVVLRVRSGRYE